MLGKLFNLGAGPNDVSAPSPASSSATGPAPILGLPPSAGSSSLRPAPLPGLPVLDSVHEDVHTRGLLFPDLQDLYETRLNNVFPLSSRSSLLPGAPSPSAFFDNRLDVELEARDLRVIVMQDSLGSVAQSLLYDSQPSPPQPPPPSQFDRPSTATAATAQDARRGGGMTSPRKSSAGQNVFAQRPTVLDTTPPSRQGPHDSRRSSVQGRPQAYVESESQRTWREYREELASFSACIFGSSDVLAYKGISTKLHVLSEPRLSDHAWSALSDGRASVARSTARASRLSHSFSSEGTAPFAMPPNSTGATRKKILITRLFPVSLPLDQDLAVPPPPPPPPPPPQARFSEDGSSFPFPHASADDAKSHHPKRGPPPAQPRQKRTPMYAIALVVNLPAAPSHSSTGHGGLRGFRGSSSYTEQESLSSSLNSTRPGGWTMVSGALESPDLGLNAADAEDPMDHVLKHWDIIMRALTHLQSIVCSTIYAMLRQSELASLGSLSAPLAPVSEQQMAQAASQAASSSSSSSVAASRRSEDGAMSKTFPKTIAPYLTLKPNCLLENERIGGEVDLAKARIVAGLRASRVVTGQNRWPIWREEARWIARWTAAKNQAPFLTNLLTAFLATHTDWLQALSPPSYRRLLPSDSRTIDGAEDAVPARTIIVSHDKMAARRLIFLLSAFLPASQQLSYVRMPRPGTSANPGSVSHSPPSLIVPILKEESLRRKINRRTGSYRASHSRNVSNQSQVATQGGGGPGGVPLPLAHLAMDSGGSGGGGGGGGGGGVAPVAHHERRASDATSVWNANRPGQSGTDGNGSRKSGAATPATIIPDASIPHFATARRTGSFGAGRPTSANSVAVDDLRRLARDDAAGNDSRYGLRGWGNVISGLLGTRKKDEARVTPPQRRSRDALREPGSGGPTLPISPARSSPSGIPSETLTREVRKARGSASTPPPPRPGIPEDALERPPGGAQADEEDQQRQSVAPQNARLAARPPHTMGAFESPVKTSINVDDGVIDVDVPFPDYITSFETAVSSPSSSGYLSTPSLFIGGGGGGGGNNGAAGGTFDTFEQLCRPVGDGEITNNVAGWLQNCHPDFVLQGLPPQPDLIEQIKWSLRAEPTTVCASPSVTSSTPDGRMCGEASVGLSPRWVDVSTAIVADTTNFSITRIRCRRLIQTVGVTDQTPIIIEEAPPSSSSLSMPPDAAGPYTYSSEPGPRISSTSEGVPEDGPAKKEKETTVFIIETLSSHDDALADAVERIVSCQRIADHQMASTLAPAATGSDPAVGGGAVDGAETAVVKDFSTGDGDGDADVGEAVVSSGTPRNVARQTTGTPFVAGLAVPPPAVQGVPREQCKTVILSALESIAQEVAEELGWKGKGKSDGEAGSQDGVADDGRKDKAKRPHDAHRSKDNILREATRAWLERAKNYE